MTVIRFTQKEWNDMRFLQDDLKFMKSKNESGQWDAAIENEANMLSERRRAHLVA